MECPAYAMFACVTFSESTVISLTRYTASLQTSVVGRNAPVRADQTLRHGYRLPPQTPHRCTAHLRLPLMAPHRHHLLPLSKRREGRSTERLHLVPSRYHEFFNQCTRGRYRTHRRSQSGRIRVHLSLRLHPFHSVSNGSRHFGPNGLPRKRCDGAHPRRRRHCHAPLNHSGSAQIWL